MNLRLRAVLSLGMAVIAGSFGCSSAQADADSAGGAAGSSGAYLAGASNLGGGASNLGGGASAGGGGAGAGTAGVPGSACPEQLVPRLTDGPVLSLPLALVMAGKPFVFGEPNARADGGSLVPLNLRFYISEVQLLQSSGEPLAVDVLTAGGAPAPYGVHLFNAEDDASSTLRVRAPAGDYTGLSFALGIKLGCNQQLPSSLGDPLTDVSQMTWPHTGGFLFLRYEGRYTAADGGATEPAGLPPAVHMGGDITKEMVPRVTVSGAFSVPASGSLEKGIDVVMDEVFAGATADIDVSDSAVGLLSTPESIAGERLRRDLPKLHPFVLQP